MKKRFHDTDIWKKDWFLNLLPEEKAFWYYITSNCDAVGVWDAYKELAEFCIGTKIDYNEFIKKTNGNIEKMQNGKWFIVNFCKFQYGSINFESKSPVMRNIINLLKKHKLIKRFKREFYNPTEDKQEKKEYFPAVRLTEKEYNKLCTDYGEKLAREALEKLSDYKLAKGRKYKSDYHACLVWAIESAGGKPKELLKLKKPLRCPKCNKKVEIGQSLCYNCGYELRDKGG